MNIPGISIRDLRTALKRIESERPRDEITEHVTIPILNLLALYVNDDEITRFLSNYIEKEIE